MAEQLFDDLDAEEQEQLREVFNEFRQFLASGNWTLDAKKEAKRRVGERRQAALREQYDAEVADIEHVEGRLRLRDEYRKRGLEI